MIHFKKAVFSVKRIECYVNFKSIVDEGINDAGIDLNYAHPENHIPEAESN